MVQQRDAVGGPVAGVDVCGHAGLFAALFSRVSRTMNKKNLSELVIRQSEFKGEIGVARCDITPPPGIYSRSWGSALHDAAEGIHRPLFVICMFLRGGTPKLDLYLNSNKQDKKNNKTQEQEKHRAII